MPEILAPAGDADKMKIKSEFYVFVTACRIRMVTYDFIF